MRTFSYTDMNRVSGEILDAAAVEPILLTKGSKAKVVIISIDEYRSLVGAAAAEGYEVANLPEDVDRELEEGLQQLIGDDDA